MEQTRLMVRAVVEYDGSDFSGFQVQPARRTVGGELEAALQAVFGTRTPVASAGRTDAGVHASGQVISFVLPRPFPMRRLALALNSVLPPDLAVREVASVDADFSARFSAVERRYEYAIYNAPARSPLLHTRAYHVWSRLDLAAMRIAAESLQGEHDFRSFCASLPQSGPTLRTLRLLAVAREGALVRVSLAGDGFLHRMVRNIVGTLVECGIHRRDPNSMLDVLARGERAAAGRTAPSHGLYLAGVRYPDGFDSYRAPPIFAC